jgi:putative tryptophan/tyrosine transport system substrate-binding protein
MKRRTCITAAAAAFALPSAVCAQTSRTWRVCSAHTSAAAGTRSFEEAFLDGLRELGFERGRNLEDTARYADGDPARLPGVVDEVLALKPDLVFCIEAVARVMRSKTTTVPIVLTFSSDPVGTGLAQSLARPGGNVTGVATLADGLAAKSIELLVEVLPKMKTLAMLLDPGVPSSVKLELPMVEAARTKRVRAVTYWARDRASLEQALLAIERDRPDALLQPAGSGILYGERRFINDSTLRLRLPYAAPAVSSGDGTLLTYGADLHGLHRQAATHAARILKGANPAELPIELPTRFELVLNLKVAQAIGVTFPQTVRLRAERVIE